MLEVKDVTKSYGNGGSRTQVLKKVSLQLLDGEFVVILGPSGSGKSTLLNVISGIERRIRVRFFMTQKISQHYLIRD